MSAPAALLEAALSLPEDDRAELALRLVESLEPPGDEDAATTWDAELSTRIEALRAGRAETVPAEQALAKAHARIRTGRG